MADKIERKQASTMSVATMLGLVMATLSGGIYVGSLSTSVDVLQDAVAEDDIREKEDIKADTEIVKAIVRIETKQEAMVKKLDKAADVTQANARKLDRILNKLEKP